MKTIDYLNGLTLKMNIIDYLRIVDEVVEEYSKQDGSRISQLLVKLLEVQNHLVYVLRAMIFPVSMLLCNSRQQ